MAVGQRVVVSMVRTLESNANQSQLLCNKFKKLCLPFTVNGKHSLYGK
jgi:hypothetical protein